MKTHLGRIVGTIVVLVIALGFLHYLAPNVSGFIEVSIFFSIVLSFWGAYLGRAGKVIQWIAVLISLVLFFSAWGFTKHLVQSKTHDLQTAMAGESETVNPESEMPKPGEPDTGFMVKFQERPDGVIEKVPITWNRNKWTSVELPKPGTREYWEILNRYEVQEAQRRLQKETKGNSPSVPAIVQLTPENPVGAFKAGPGQQTAEYTYPVNWSPSDFEVVITEGTGTLVINHKYRVEGVVPSDKRLDDLRGVGIVPTFESIVSYQIVGGPITGLVKTSW